MSVATLDGYKMPYNPESISWGYTLNATSTDTLGGRVVQILSVRVDNMNWQGVAGSRSKLISLYEKIQRIMDKHVDTKEPVRLIIPSRNWSFMVYVKAMPEMKFDVRTVSFEYSLELEVYEDYGSLTPILITEELERLSTRIGFNTDFFQWIGKGSNTEQRPLQGIMRE